MQPIANEPYLHTKSDTRTMKLSYFSLIALSKASYWRGVDNDYDVFDETNKLPYPTDPSQYRQPEPGEYIDYDDNGFDSTLPYPTVTPQFPTSANPPQNPEVFTMVDDSPPSHKEIVQMGDVKMFKSQFNNLLKVGEENLNKEPDPLESILKWDAYLINGRYKIAYKIDENSFYDKGFEKSDVIKLKAIMKKVEHDFYTKTSIEYGVFGKSRDFNHEHFITFTANSKQGLTSCMSFLGRIGNPTHEPYLLGDGEQEISLSEKFCLNKNTIIRELVHSLGFIRF